MSNPDAPDSKPEGWESSLLEVFREVLRKLPEDTSLGELVKATQANPHIAPVLQILSVQELIDLAATRPKVEKKPSASEGPVDDGTMVIRRRSEVPDGDLRVLRALCDSLDKKTRAGAMPESELATRCNLSEDQVRLILRQLNAKSLVVVEGSGARKRVRITRQGQQHLRKKIEAEQAE